MNLLNRYAKNERDYSYGYGNAVFGIIVIIFGIFAFYVVNCRIDYPTTEAVVTDVELYEEAHYEGETLYNASYTIYFTYNVDGQEYEGKFDDREKEEVGNVIEINYNPSDPTDVSWPNSMLIPIIIIVGGGVMVTVGLVNARKIKEKNQRLKEQEEEWNFGKNL